jgi:hypothetical protein
MKEKHLILGALTVPRTNYASLVEEFVALKAQLGFRPGGEIKWGKVSHAYMERYQRLSVWFFEHLRANNFTFRAHVMDTTTSAWRAYGKGDQERSFYKAYFHVLFQSVCRLAMDVDGNSVLILLDDKLNRYPFHLPDLKRGLNIRLGGKLKLPKLVSNVEPRRSSGPKSEPLIQIVDLLIGAIAFVRNDHILAEGASSAKIEMASFLEKMAGTKFKYDTTSRAPFNIFTFDVSIAMARKQEHLAKAKMNRPTA